MYELLDMTPSVLQKTLDAMCIMAARARPVLVEGMDLSEPFTLERARELARRMIAPGHNVDPDAYAHGLRIVRNWDKFTTLVD